MTDGNEAATGIADEFGHAQRAAAAPQAGVRYHHVTTAAEVLRLMDIAKQYHIESRYAEVPFSERKFTTTYARMVRSKNTLSVTAELNGRPVGLMGAKVGEYFLGEGWRIATNYIFYVSPDVRGTFVGGRIAVKLLRIFVEWAHAVGANEINMHAVSGIDPAKTDKFLRNAGFQPYGGNYARQLENGR